MRLRPQRPWLRPLTKRFLPQRPQLRPSRKTLLRRKQRLTLRTSSDAPAADEDAEADAAAEAAAADVEDAPAAEGEEAPAAEAAPTPPPPPAPRVYEGPEPTTMEELLAEQTTEIRSLKHGDVVEGNVVRIDKDEILVDIGAKSEGVISNRELYGRNAESQPELNIGDQVLVYVLQPESPEGHAVLSLRRAGLERKWRAMQEQLDEGVIIEAPVIDHNKGGLIVDCGIRGFVPISQIVDFPRRPQNEQPRDAAQEIAEKLQPYVGRKLRLKILEVNRKANRLILSEKVALYEERREKRDELFSSLQVGQKVTGTVRSIAPFGVFVDLGGIDGLVHKSELSWNKVNNPEAGYRVGEEVEAEVIDINHERGRISLSIRRLQPDPWHSTVADLKVGDVIDGTVTKIVNFGAFVRVRDGLEGLIHISRAVAPARHPSGRRRPRGPDAQAQDHLARPGAASPGPFAQAGRGGAGRGAGDSGGASRAPARVAVAAVALRHEPGRPGAGRRHRQHAGRRVRPGPPADRRDRSRPTTRWRRGGTCHRGDRRHRSHRRSRGTRRRGDRRSRGACRPTPKPTAEVEAPAAEATADAEATAEAEAAPPRPTADAEAAAEVEARRRRGDCRAEAEARLRRGGGEPAAEADARPKSRPRQEAGAHVEGEGCRARGRRGGARRAEDVELPSSPVAATRPSPTDEAPRTIRQLTLTRIPGRWHCRVTTHVRVSLAIPCRDRVSTPPQ